MGNQPILPRPSAAARASLHPAVYPSKPLRARRAPATRHAPAHRRRQQQPCWPLSRSTQRPLLNVVVAQAQPSTITGSIGVFSARFSAQELLSRLGVWTDVDTAGADRFAGSDSAWHRPMSEDEVARSRKMVEDIYGSFVQKVAECRQLDAAHVDEGARGQHSSCRPSLAMQCSHGFVCVASDEHAPPPRPLRPLRAELARGRVWFGDEAVANGLVDSLGGLEEALVGARFPGRNAICSSVLSRGGRLCLRLIYGCRLCDCRCENGGGAQAVAARMAGICGGGGAFRRELVRIGKASPLERLTGGGRGEKLWSPAASQLLGRLGTTSGI